MSYRAFKRLFGETNLEQKCRYMFGAVTLLLIVASFMWYAYQTEHLAYDQTSVTGRQLIAPILTKKHKRLLHANGPLLDVLDQFQMASEERLPEALRQYQHSLIMPNARTRENVPDDGYERQLLEDFLADDKKYEDSRLIPSQHVLIYYGAVRALTSCVSAGCHPRPAEREAAGDLKEGDLIGIVKIRMPTYEIEKGAVYNRAWLISTAIITAVFLMIGSWLIVRYVIVKPVKHLKEVSDAIAAGELNVRSEIQTGDEFEDLSHAFNRMLRNLVSMQDRWRKVNAELDRKVDELARANLALYESNRVKSDFLATMSHELRTPLNSILGFSEVLRSSPLTDKQGRWVGNIQASGEQLLHLINDVLDLAKIEAGKMQVVLEEFAPEEVFEGVLTMFRPLAEKKNIDLRGQYAPNLPAVRQDVIKVRQIFSNLLSNAVKFTPEGGRVTLKVEADPAFLVVTVADTGVGIATEDQELVFEKFRQAGNPLTREHAGTGLGLSIVRELCKLLGGEVTLQSELGRGSTFTVRLALRLSPEPRLEFDLSGDGIYLMRNQRLASAGLEPLGRMPGSPLWPETTPPETTPPPGPPAAPETAVVADARPDATPLDGTGR